MMFIKYLYTMLNMSGESIVLVYSTHFLTNDVLETTMIMYSKTIKHLRLVTLQRKIYCLTKTHPAIVYTT